MGVWSGVAIPASHFAREQRDAEREREREREV